MDFMDDKLFNQVIIILGFTVVTILYTLSWVFNKPLDLQGFFLYAVPALLQIANIFKSAAVTTTSIRADASKQVASITGAPPNGAPKV